MTLINLLVAPIRRVANFPLFQLMTAIAVILLLQAADSRSRRNIQRAPWRLISPADMPVRFPHVHC